MSDEGLSFEEYRERVERQRVRDRERFTGVDSHPEEPLYSSPLGAQLFAASTDALLEPLQERLRQFAIGFQRALAHFAESLARFAASCEVASSSQSLHVRMRSTAPRRPRSGPRRRR